MSVRASGLPLPELETSPDAEAYWNGAAAGRLVLPRCRSCAHVIWYPRPFCPRCGSRDVEWFEASGEGAVYSYTIVHRSQGDYEDRVPYVVAYVELNEGPRVLSNLVDGHGPVEIGQRVRAVFERNASGQGLLRFEVASGDPQ